jgi:hypothetical protein
MQVKFLVCGAAVGLSYVNLPLLKPRQSRVLKEGCVIAPKQVAQLVARSPKLQPLETNSGAPHSALPQKAPQRAPASMRW